jgi:hypothetical protein
MPIDNLVMVDIRQELDTELWSGLKDLIYTDFDKEAYEYFKLLFTQPLSTELNESRVGLSTGIKYIW